jgi:Putative adhesin
MKRATSLMGLVAILLTTLVPAGKAEAANAQAGDFRWRGVVAAGRTVEIRGINGRVEATPAAGGEVEVSAAKHGRRSSPAEVRVEVIEHAGGVTICAVYPSRDASNPNVCAPGGGGRMNVENNDVQVDFTVRVPAGVRFHGLTVNGDVEARGLGADVEAKTVNGNINVSTGGLVSAKTVNGSITAALGRADWTGSLEFATVNGGIELSLPASLSTEIEVGTLNGEIQSDFPLTVTGRFSRRRLTGTIGGGGRELSLKTVNGSVHLRRGA